MIRCTDCGAPGSSRCQQCWRILREDRTAYASNPLPPRETEPPALPFCQVCGALRNVVRYGDESRCPTHAEREYAR